MSQESKHHGSFGLVRNVFFAGGESALGSTYSSSCTLSATKLWFGWIAALGTISSERSASAGRLRLSGADAEGKTKLPPVAHGDGEGVIIVVSAAKCRPSRRTRPMYYDDHDDNLPRAMPLPKSADLSKIRWVFWLGRNRANIPKRAAIDAALLRLAPAIPPHERMAVVDHAVDSRGLSMASPGAAAWLSLVAYVRHTFTDYDELLAEGYDPDSARHFVASQMDKILQAWGVRRRLTPKD